MANLTKSELIRNFSTPFGVLELLSQLIRHPKDDYELGSGDSKVIFSNREVKALVDDFQRNNLLGDKILDLDNPTNYRSLYNNILLFASKQKESSIPDRETRENILRTYQTHLEEVDQKVAHPKVEINAFNESVKRSQKYWQTQNLLESRISQALEPLENSGTSSSTYIRQMRSTLIQELSPALQNIDTRDPIKAKLETQAIIENALLSSQSWRTLENTLVTEGKDLGIVSSGLTSLLNNEKLSREENNLNSRSLVEVNQTFLPTVTESRDGLESAINTWQKNNGVGGNNPSALGKDLIESLRVSAIKEVESPSLRDRFFQKDSPEVRALRKALTPELIKKYQLTRVDQERLIEATINNPSTGTFFERITHGLEPGPGDLPDILGLRPAGLVSHIAKSAGVDPTIIALTRNGYSGEQLAKQLLNSGYSASDIKSQLDNIQKYLGENHGLIDSIYKSRLAYDQTILKIKTALSPANIPIVRNIYGAIVNIREGISTTYNNFLNNHRTLAFFLSSDHRLASWGGWISKIAANKNLPSWLKTGLTWYKNGGYSYEGFINSAKTFYRIKFGNWLIKQGAKIGGEKLAGKFMAWVGAGLVAGSLSGGATFAIQAGLWVMQQAKRAPEAIKNADVVAGWVLKNLAGIAMLIGIAGPTIIGAIIGFGIALISFFIIGFAAPLWAVLAIGTGIGALIGFLYSQAGAISAWAGGALNSLGALASTWWAGFVNSVGATISSIATTSIVVAVGGITISMSLGNDAIITSKIETSAKQSEDSYLCNAQSQPKPSPGNIIFSNDKKYAFPVSGFTDYACYHWDGVMAVDIFTGQSAYQDPEKNLPVVAYTSGTVSMVVMNDELGGKYIILKGDDGRYYYYAHNCGIYVSAGQRVSVGEVMATTDQSGKNAAITPEHSHFAISTAENFFEGGSICPQKDFYEKFSSLKDRCNINTMCTRPIK
ncbi:MAG: peptidoglycan DD-metalloendopeptidase family protein [Microgenomates group bacterium]